MNKKVTEKEIAFIITMRQESGLTWNEITEKYNKKFKKDKNFECVKKCYQKYVNLFNQKDYHVKSLKDMHNVKKRSSYTARENKSILDLWIKRDDLIDTIAETVKGISLKKYKTPKQKKNKKLKDMTL